MQGKRVVLDAEQVEFAQSLAEARGSLKATVAALLEIARREIESGR